MIPHFTAKSGAHDSSVRTNRNNFGKRLVKYDFNLKQWSNFFWYDLLRDLVLTWKYYLNYSCSCLKKNSTENCFGLFCQAFFHQFLEEQNITLKCFVKKNKILCFMWICHNISSHFRFSANTMCIVLSFWNLNSITA